MVPQFNNGGFRLYETTLQKVPGLPVVATGPRRQEHEENLELDARIECIFDGDSVDSFQGTRPIERQHCLVEVVLHYNRRYLRLVLVQKQGQAVDPEELGWFHSEEFLQHPIPMIDT